MLLCLSAQSSLAVKSMPAALCQANTLSRSAHGTRPKQHRTCNVTSTSKMQSTAAAATAAAALLMQASLLAPPVYAVDIAQTTEHSWQPCPNGLQCVSTNSFMQPAQYLPAWLYQPDSFQTALRSLLDELSAREAELLEVDEADGYVAARVWFGGGDNDVDTLQFRLLPDGVVLFKSQAAANRPYPPFCFTPGCISGPGNRQRLETLRDDLGWSVMETDEDKKWVQILLH